MGEKVKLSGEIWIKISDLDIGYRPNLNHPDERVVLVNPYDSIIGFKTICEEGSQEFIERDYCGDKKDEYLNPVILSGKEKFDYNRWEDCLSWPEKNKQGR